MQENEAQPLEDPNRDQDAPSLGQILRRARETQGLTLEQICAELRFEQHLLEALEADRLEQLGAPVFAKGYIKHYGQRLGLAYKDLLARYHAAVGRQDVVIEPSRAIKLRDERQITAWIIAGLALLLIGVVLFVWWVNDIGEPAPRPPVQPTAAPARDAPAAADLPGPIEGRSDAREAAGGPTRTQPAQDGADALRGARAAEPVPDPTGADQAAEPAAAARLDADAAGAVPDAESVPDAVGVAPDPESVDNGAPSPGPGQVRLELVFVEDSWAEVSDADGQRLVYRLGRAGQSERVTGRAPLSVFLGNAAGVRVVADGDPFAIPAAARRGDLAEFRVGESGN